MKKVLTIFIALSCLFFNVYQVDAAEKQDVPIEPLGITYSCPNCEAGIMRRATGSNHVYCHHAHKANTHGKRNCGMNYSLNQDAYRSCDRLQVQSLDHCFFYSLHCIYNNWIKAFSF